MSSLLKYLPSYEKDSEVFKEITKAEQFAFSKLGIDIKDLEKQLSIDTATWGLIIYERELGIKTVLNKPLEERRSVIKSKWRGTGKVDRLLIKAVVDAYTNGEVEIGFNGEIIVKFTGVYGIPSNLEDAKKAVEDIAPAHLGIVYQFAYLLIRDIHEVKTLNEMEAIELHKFTGGENIG